MSQPAQPEQLMELMAKLVAELCHQGLLTEEDSAELLGDGPGQATSPRPMPGFLMTDLGEDRRLSA